MAQAEVQSGKTTRLDVRTGDDTGDLDRFLAGLTQLSQESGIAINGTPELFIMETEDRSFGYACDADGRLKRA